MDPAPRNASARKGPVVNARGQLLGRSVHEVSRSPAFRRARPCERATDVLERPGRAAPGPRVAPRSDVRRSSDWDRTIGRGTGGTQDGRHGTRGDTPRTPFSLRRASEGEARDAPLYRCVRIRYEGHARPGGRRSKPSFGRGRSGRSASRAGRMRPNPSGSDRSDRYRHDVRVAALPGHCHVDGVPR